MSITPVVNATKNEVRWTLRTGTYPMDAVYGASYVFLDRCYVYLDKPDGKQVEVVLRGKKKLGAKALEALAGEFANQLLHQVLRARLAKRTGKVREMIIGRALFSAEGPEDDYVFQDELDDEFDDLGDDYLDDPLGIAVPWEEKYGNEEDRQGAAEQGAQEPREQDEKTSPPAPEGGPGSAGTP